MGIEMRLRLEGSTHLNLIRYHGSHPPTGYYPTLIPCDTCDWMTVDLAGKAVQQILRPIVHYVTVSARPPGKQSEDEGTGVGRLGLFYGFFGLRPALSLSIAKVSPGMEQ
ncbi:hypothetical protein CC2G_000357 [Coprinopsis cinerea AmutBmut pab1-1]|nr:hypothetical protein CC2G_000357 [Coprinopsis cinerea AmutBmut pab1-1]